MSSCEGCGSPHVVYRNYKDQALCCPCAMCCPDTESEPALKRQMLGPDVAVADGWVVHPRNQLHDYSSGCDAGPKCRPAEVAVKRRMVSQRTGSEHDKAPECSAEGCIPADEVMSVQMLPPKGPGDSTPSHYQGNGMTPFDVWDAFDLDRYEANAVKYLLRWRKKNGVEDLKKAEHYVQILIQRAEAGK